MNAASARDLVELGAVAGGDGVTLARGACSFGTQARVRCERRDSEASLSQDSPVRAAGSGRSLVAPRKQASDEVLVVEGLAGRHLEHRQIPAPAHREEALFANQVELGQFCGRFPACHREGEYHATRERTNFLPFRWRAIRARARSRHARPAPNSLTEARRSGSDRFIIPRVYKSAYHAETGEGAVRGGLRRRGTRSFLAARTFPCVVECTCSTTACK